MWIFMYVHYDGPKFFRVVSGSARIFVAGSCTELMRYSRFV